MKPSMIRRLAITQSDVWGSPKGMGFATCPWHKMRGSLSADRQAFVL